MDDKATDWRPNQILDGHRVGFFFYISAHAAGSRTPEIATGVRKAFQDLLFQRVMRGDCMTSYGAWGVAEEQL
ncbi:hypothetical protein [Corticibacter populi]|uniref:hypothetical protein n=1 Tax=Corticibacter populi TaxID=1550736 RepID=UPI00102AD210|nr:hypothetical protein [Corticibacter populi]